MELDDSTFGPHEQSDRGETLRNRHGPPWVANELRPEHGTRLIADCAPTSATALQQRA